MVIRIYIYILANFTAIFHFNTPSKCQSSVWGHFQGILKWKIGVKWVNTPAFSISLHCVQSVRIRGFSGLYFHAFALSTERYSVQIRIQSECPYSVEMQENTDQKNSKYGHFSRSVTSYLFNKTNWRRLI